MSSILYELWKLYEQLRNENSEKIIANSKIVYNLIFNHQITELNESIENNKEVIFFHGYSALRFFELVTLNKINIEEKLLISKTYENEKLFLEDINKRIFEEIIILDIIYSLKKGVIATKYRKNKGLEISSPLSQNAIDFVISNKLESENFYWNDIFTKISNDDNHIIIKVKENHSGQVIIAKEELIKDWNNVKNYIKLDSSDNLWNNSELFFKFYNKIKDGLLPIPFTNKEEKLLKKEFKFTKQESIAMYDMLTKFLPELQINKLPTILEEITEELFNYLYEIGLGWKLSINSQDYYHLSKKDSGKLFIDNLFYEYFKSRNIETGYYFEAILKRRIDLFDKGFFAISRPNSGFLFGEPTIRKEKKEKEERLQIKTLTNIEIEIPKVIEYSIQPRGEIDLIIHTNNNLFLIETKSFFSDKPNFQKAAEQCTKYLEWIKTKKSKEFLAENGIDNWNKVFILIVTNGQERKLTVKSNQSAHTFAIISFSFLISLFLGHYITEIPAYNSIDEATAQNLKLLMERHFSNMETKIKYNEKNNLFRNTWRRYVNVILNSFYKEPDGSFDDILEMPTGFVLLDHRYQKSGKWELEEEVFIDNLKDYKIYLVTELANNKHTYICNICKKIWLYYWPIIQSGTNNPLIDKKQLGNIDSSLSNGLCYKCGNKLMDESSKQYNELVKETLDKVIYYKIRIQEGFFS